jgi:hypothetical protein
VGPIAGLDEPSQTRRTEHVSQSRIYRCRFPEVIKMRRSLSGTIYLCYDNFFPFFLISYNNKNVKLTFREFREVNVSIISVDFISVPGGQGVTVPIAPV